jgi:ankyrin repeat protein
MDDTHHLAQLLAHSIYIHTYIYSMCVMCPQQLLQVIDALSKDGASQAQQVDYLNQVDTDGTSVLMAAAAAGNVRVAAQLLGRGAVVNTQNVDGHTALMFAYNGMSQEEALLQNYRQYVLDGAEGDEGGGEGDEGGGDEGDEDGGRGGQRDGVVLLIEEALRSRQELISLLLEGGADPLMQVMSGCSSSSAVNAAVTKLY